MAAGMKFQPGWEAAETMRRLAAEGVICTQAQIGTACGKGHHRKCPYSYVARPYARLQLWETTAAARTAPEKFTP